MPSFLASKKVRPPLAVPSAIATIESLTDSGEVLLGAGQDAGLRGRVRLVLVDVDADAR